MGFRMKRKEYGAIENYFTIPTNYNREISKIKEKILHFMLKNALYE